MLYRLRSGCPWRALSSDFPKWRTVHAHFQIWSELNVEGVSLFARAHKNQVGVAREKQGRSAYSAFLMVDASRVKDTDMTRRKGYDAGRKVSRIKRHLAVDKQDLPHAIAVTTAAVTDRQGALLALALCKATRQQVTVQIRQAPRTANRQDDT